MLRGKNQNQEMPDTQNCSHSDFPKLPAKLKPFIKASAEYLGLEKQGDGD